MFTSRTLAAAAAAALLTMGALSTAVPASASTSALPTPALQTCTGASLLGTGTTQTFSPGLKNEPAKITTQTTSKLPCVGVPLGQTANLSVTSTRVQSCTELLTTSTGSKQIVWNNDQARTSTFNYTRTVVRAEGTTTITFDGVLTSDSKVFPGARALETVVAANTDLDKCSSSTGLTQITYLLDELVIGKVA